MTASTRQWLEGLGFVQYADAFEANDIAVDLLPQISDQVLKDIGVASDERRFNFERRPVWSRRRASASMARAGGPMGRSLLVARRTFICGAAAAWAALPQVGAAQSATRTARVAFLTTADRNSGAMQFQVDPLRAGLRELGWVEGQNLVIDLHWADNDADRLPALLADLLRQRPDVIVTVGSRPALAAKDAAAGALPIVAVYIDDPVQMGLAKTYANPGGNVTGVSAAFRGIFARRLQLLKDIAPTARKFAVLYNPDTVKRAEVAEGIARNEATLGVPVAMFEARRREDIDAAFAAMASERVQAVTILADAVFWAERERLIALCLKQRLPAAWSHRGYVELGGLVSYQGDSPAMFKRSAVLVDKILKGANPGDIPFEQSTKLDLALNLRTAKALGLAIPQAVRLSADALIE